MTTTKLKIQDQAALELEILCFVTDLVQEKKKYKAKGNVQKCNLNDVSNNFNRRHPGVNFKSFAGCPLKKFLVERCGLTKIDGNGNIDVAGDDLQLLLEKAKAKQTTNETKAPRVFSEPEPSSSTFISSPAIKADNAEIKFRPKDPLLFPETGAGEAEQYVERGQLKHADIPSTIQTVNYISVQNISKDVNYNVNVNEGGVGAIGPNNTIIDQGQRQRNEEVLHERITSVEKELKQLNESLKAGKIIDKDVEEKMKIIDPVGWDEWIKLDKSVCSFDKNICQYLLIADRLPERDLENYSILGSIHWKFVLDLDPESDEKGLNYRFKGGQNRDAIITPHTPSSIKQQKENLGKNLDLNKMQWVFVNGQSQDDDNEPKTTMTAWKNSYASSIKRFMDSCVTKFDNLKPVVCVILSLRALGKEIIPKIVESLVEHLCSNDFKFRFVLINEHSSLFDDIQELERYTILPSYFESGVRSLLGSPKSKYQLPSSTEGIPIDLELQQYLNLKENLDIFYLGCHELSTNEDKETKERNKKAHRESFYSGNPISFLSLYYREDAQREISRVIISHLQKLLPRLTSTKIEEISHAPGTGGTTIARRVLWELHKEYPCAIANISFLNPQSIQNFQEEPSVEALADNIGYLDEICKAPPIILLDGKSSITEPLSDQLARKLSSDGRKAVLLCCTRYIASKEKQWKDKDSFQHCSPHKVNVELEDSDADLEEFKKKYKEYITVTGLEDASRVFHFPLMAMEKEYRALPLMAMQKEYRAKLKQMIDKSLADLQSNKYEYEIMVLVAFLFIYAEHPTPALFIYEVFQKKFNKIKQGRSYSAFKSAFSKTFLNMMIGKVASYRAPRGLTGQTFESFTLQHHLVATYVLEHAQTGRSLRSIVEDFIEKKVILQTQEFRPLLTELFIYNKGRYPSLTLSVLIDHIEKEESSQVAGDLLCRVANETKDPNLYSNVARFFSYKRPDPDFLKSENLIQKALDVANISKDRKKRVYDTFGTILHVKLTNHIWKKKIKHLEDLEMFAKPAIEKFQKARDHLYYPKGFPNPLIGELKVWLTCFDWIIKYKCGQNSEAAIKFIANESPEFFRTSISTSFQLLKTVDEILETTLHLSVDTGKSKHLANKCRVSLLGIFGSQKNPNSRREAAIESVDVIKMCQQLCSKENFPRATTRELKRFQVLYIIEQATKIELLLDLEKDFLIKLLREIVIVEKDYTYGRKLFEIGCLQIKGSLSLDESLEFVRKWADKREFEHNEYIMYYRYMICFCKILEGDVFEYRPEYDNALKECKERSDKNYKRHRAQYFLGSENEGEISQLVTMTKLEMEYQNMTGDGNHNGQQDDDFWKRYAVKYLRQCEGKIYAQHSGNPYIELITGKLRISIPHWSMSELKKKYELGDRYLFYIAFTLFGPKAYELRRVQHKENQ